MRIVHGPRGAELGISHGQRYLLLEIFVIYRAFAAGNHTFQDGDYMNFCRRLLQAAESLGAFEEADQKLRRITAWARRTLPAVSTLLLLRQTSLITDGDITGYLRRAGRAFRIHYGIHT